MKKLIKFVGNTTSEIFQSLDIKFAFVNKVNEDEYKQIHLNIKCRDFLGDVLWSKVTGKCASIYGFRYNWSDVPYDEDMLRLSLTFPDLYSLENFKKNFDILNFKEHEANTAKSNYYLTDDSLSVILEADKVWQSNIWKLSLYTFYIKCISYPSLNDLQSPEDSYINVLNNGNEIKLLQKVNSHFDEVVNKEIGYSHNYAGFVSVCKNHNKDMNARLLCA